MGCGAPADVQGNSANNIGQNNSLAKDSQGTITCPAGSYAYGTFGQSGGSVDSISGLKCRNIYDGTTSTVNQGGFGGPGGKASTSPIDCGNNGLMGFWTYTKNNTNLDGLGGICRVPGAPGGRADAGLDGSSGGTCGNVHRYTGDTSRLINSVTGATSNNKVVANFGYNTLNFSTIAGYGGNSQAGAACCAGQDGSAECASGRGGGLNCPSTLQNYCSQGDRIYSDGICTAAMGNGALDGTWAKNQQLAWCQQGSNFNTDNCKNLCTASTGENSTQKEACNTLYANKCTQPANKTLDICSCSLNWSDYPADATAVINKIPGAPQEPMCYFAQCIQKGYKHETGDKISPPCPGCIQSQSIDITNSTANLKNISQSCNITTSTSTTAAAANTAASSTPSGGTTSATTTAPSVTPAPVTPVVSTPAATTATGTAVSPVATTTSKTSPLVFVGAGAAAFLLLSIVAIATTRR